MSSDNLNLLAEVVSSHKNKTVKGRTRLQKTIHLLQRLGLNTDYRYKVYFYGPYSEELSADINLLKDFDVLEESGITLPDGSPFFSFECKSSFIENKLSNELKSFIKKFEETDTITLEISSTFLAYYDFFANENEALQALRQKKPDKTSDSQLANMWDFMNSFNLYQNNT